ncbi:MAG: carboxyl transferase domain-containing protein, partial [Candidatus Thermoplasmatota archaeon]|nr:carboxyl transferase domain-containing protein [Candidatus Thermoplasmatota archaeon]
MSTIKSNHNPSSDESLANLEYNKKLVKDLKNKILEVSRGGKESAVKKHQDRGKLLVRERIDLLIDQDTPFLELSALAAIDMYKNEVPSAGIVTGIGVVHGREVMIIANDATVKGGTYFPLTVKKHLRAQEIAQENNL